MGDDDKKYKHIPIPAEDVSSKRKKPGRIIPKTTGMGFREHSRLLYDQVEEVFAISSSRSALYDDRDIYFIVKLENTVEQSGKVFEKLGLTRLVTLDAKTALVAFDKKDKAKLDGFIKAYEGGKLKSYFSNIKEIKAQDLTHKVAKSLKRKIKKQPSQKVEVEVELLPKMGEGKYRDLLDALQRFLDTRGVELSVSLLSDRYCLASARMDSETVDELLQGLDAVYKVRTTPKIELEEKKTESTSPFEGDYHHFKPSIDADTPIVGVFDTGIYSEHPLLKDCVLDAIDAIDSGGPDDLIGHGTFIAGLCAYGDNFRKRPRNPDVKVLMTKVINDRRGYISSLANIIEDIVRRYSPKVRVYNLSINWNKAEEISILSEDLDNIARRYDVLITVSTGNIHLQEIREYLSNNSQYPDYLENPNSTILSPAEGCNILAVGSMALLSNKSALAPAGQPSPFTRCGRSSDGRWRPDLVEHGGNSTKLAYFDEQIAMKSLGRSRSEFFSHDIGTSFANPLVARMAAKILHAYPGASTNMLKALLVHSALLREQNEGKKPSHPTGFGMPDLDKALYSDPHCCTYILDSSLNLKYEATIPFRIPQVMDKIKGKKRIIFTLVYDPPVDRTTFRYQLVNLGITFQKGATGRRTTIGPKNFEATNKQTRHNIKFGIFAWQRSGYGSDWSLTIKPSVKDLPKEITYQRFALVISIIDPTRSVDIYKAIQEEMDEKNALKYPQSKGA